LSKEALIILLIKNLRRR